MLVGGADRGRRQGSGAAGVRGARDHRAGADALAGPRRLPSAVPQALTLRHLLHRHRRGSARSGHRARTPRTALLEGSLTVTPPPTTIIRASSTQTAATRNFWRTSKVSLIMALAPNAPGPTCAQLELLAKAWLAAASLATRHCRSPARKPAPQRSCPCLLVVSLPTSWFAQLPLSKSTWFGGSRSR
jgi:hypothetical protein